MEMLRRPKTRVVYDGDTWVASSPRFPTVHTSAHTLHDTLQAHTESLTKLVGVTMQLDATIVTADAVTEQHRSRLAELAAASNLARAHLHDLNRASHTARHELIRHLYQLGLPIASIAAQSNTSRAQTTSIVREIQDGRS